MRCEDCKREWDVGDAGWIGVRLEQDPKTGEPVVLLYCPDCAEQFERKGDEVAPPTDS
jgi:hypothetical protein